MPRSCSISPLTRLVSGLVILVVLFGATSQVQASDFEKGKFLIELNDQAINFSNPAKIKPSGLKELIGCVSLVPEDALPVNLFFEGEFSIGSAERNPFYVVVTANAP